MEAKRARISPEYYEKVKQIFPFKGHFSETFLNEFIHFENIDVLNKFLNYIHDYLGDVIRTKLTHKIDFLEKKKILLQEHEASLGLQIMREPENKVEIQIKLTKIRATIGILEREIFFIGDLCNHRGVNITERQLDVNVMAHLDVKEESSQESETTIAIAKANFSNHVPNLSELKEIYDF